MLRSESRASSFAHTPVRFVAWFVSAILLAVMLPMNVVPPAAAQGDGETYSVTVRKFECREVDGFDPYQSDLNGLFANCDLPHGGVPFNLSTDDPNYQGGTRATGDDGGTDATWSGIPLGSTFTLQEEIPDGYGLPMIACLAYSAPWDANAGASNPGFSFGEGSVSAFMQDAYAGTPYVGCYWFNVPSGDNGDQQNNNQQGGAGTITIQKYTCWIDVPESGGDPLDQYQDYLDACSTGYPGARFRISNNGDETYTVDSNGQVSHDSYGGGYVEIRELQPYWPHPVVAIAYCTTTDPGGQTSPVDVFQSQDGVVTYDLPSGSSVYCDWFNIFVPATAVYKYVCPDDRDYRELDLEELIQSCSPENGYRFTLTQEPQYQADEKDTQNGGIVSWTYDNHQNGQDYPTTIEELDGGDYRYKRIYCTTAMPGAYPVVTYAAVIESSSITYDHPGRSQVVCAWFNVPEYEGDENGQGGNTGDTGGTGQVIIFKYVCSPDYPENGGYEDWQADCSADPAVSGYEYQLTGEGGYDSSMSTGANGMAGWDDAPAGSLTLREINLSGYRTGAVFCGTAPLNVEPDLEPVTHSSDAVELDLQADYLIGCLWFNVPDTGNGGGGSTVTIYKHVCGDTYPENGSYQDWQAACLNSVSGSGYSFTLTDDAGYSEEMTTDGSGMAVWENAPYGELALIESSVPGYRTGAVFCGSAAAPEEPEPVTPELIQNGNRSGFDRQDGYNTVCAWFNIPAEFGRIEIYKYYCDSGYDESSLSKEYLEGYCSPEENIDFEYLGPNGASNSATTDSSGFLAWDDLEAGPYEIYELERPDYRPLAVFCAVVYDPSESGTYDQAELFGWQVPYELPSGGTLRCYWFNADAYYGTIEIYKYYCEPGYDESSLTKEYLESYCSPQEGIEFEYFGPSGASDFGTTDPNGWISWENVPSGGYEFFENTHGDYRPFRVYCAPWNASEESYDEVPLDEWSIFYEIPAGYSLRCYWFNTEYAYGAIEIYKYYCEPGYDESSSSKEYLESYCSPEENVTFEYAGPNNGGPELSTDQDGYVRWDEISPGFYEISEWEREGYRPYRVYCALYFDPSDSPTYDEAPLNGWTVGYDIPEGATLTCYWFNIDYHEAGRVILHKYVCDEQLDETSLSYEYLRSYCTEPQEGVRYDAEWSDGSSDWQETDQDGYLEWDSVPLGSLTIYENVPADYRLVRVYCTQYTPDQGPADDEYSNVTQGQNQMFWGDLWDGYVLECYWFNVPYEDTGYGTVTIYKYYCPDDYDPSNTDAGYYESYCSNEHEGVEFELVRDSDNPRTATTGSDGTAHWTDVESGSLEITESLPPGYVAVRIWCSTYPRDGAPSYYEGVPVYNGRSMSYHLQEGYSLTCYWYNAPYEDEYGTVTIYKYTCDDGYDHSSLSREYLESYCTEPYEDVDFDLYYEHDDPVTMTTSDSGEAFWDEVYGGSLQLYEYVPDGYTILRVYCAAYPASGSPGSYTEMPVSEGSSVYYDLPYGYSLICYWYNTPVAGGWIEITKYACPVGYDPSHASASDYEYACQQRLTDVEFFLDQQGGSGESVSGSTDDSGVIRFEPLAYGEYYDVVETYPDDYNAAVVYCSRYTPHWGGEGPYQQYAVYNGAITVTLDEGEYLKCRWYNLRDEYGVNIRITKYECVDDAWEYGQDDLFQECDDWMGNVRFYVNSGYDRISGITSSEGEVAWEGVPAGLIRIEEVPPEGYGNRVRVYCRVIQGGDQVGPWEEATVYDGIAVEYGMAEGNTLDCYWFNFPVYDGASITVYKYHCPATADQHSTSLSGLKSKCVALTGMRMTLAAPGQQGIARITGEEGIAAWQGVPAGDIAIAEQHVYGYRTPIVYCSINGEPAERVYSGGSMIEYELDESDELRCDWFNLPEVSSSGTGQGGGIVIVNNNTSSSTSTSSSSSSSTSGGIFTGGGTRPGGSQPGGTQPGGTTPQQGAGPATLTIIKYVCPPGIDLEDPEANPSSSCNETEESVSFNLRAWDDPTDEDGTTRASAEPNIDTVAFNNLEAGEYILTELPPADSDIGWAFVLSCQSSLGQADSTRFYPLAMTRDNLSLHLTLFAGERLTCQWYNVPAGGGATVSLTVYECPGQVANPAQCDVASTPHEIEFTPVEPAGDPVLMETGPDGTAQSELPAGTYEVDDTGANTCLIDSNVLDDSNNLVIDGSVPVEVVVYTCAA